MELLLLQKVLILGATNDINQPQVPALLAASSYVHGLLGQRRSNLFAQHVLSDPKHVLCYVSIPLVHQFFNRATVRTSKSSGVLTETISTEPHIQATFSTNPTELFLLKSRTRQAFHYPILAAFIIFPFTVNVVIIKENKREELEPTPAINQVLR